MNDRLRNLVEFGADIEFICCGVPYTILAGAEEGIIIGIQNDDNNDGCYESYDEMIHNYTIGGKKMIEVLDEIEITFSS